MSRTYKSMTFSFLRALRLITNKSAATAPWQNRNLEDSVNGYLSQIGSKGSQYLCDYLDLTNIKSFLELGSNCGNRLIPLALKFPKTQFTGVDINSDAIELGKSQVLQLDLKNVTFFTFDIASSEFRKFVDDNQYEMVFSWATLMYLHPKDLRILMRRLTESSKRFVLIEQCIDGSRRHIFDSYPARNFMQWKHDYNSIFARCKPSTYEFQIRYDRLPVGIWEPGGGGGKIMRVEFP